MGIVIVARVRTAIVCAKCQKTAELCARNAWTVEQAALVCMPRYRAAGWVHDRHVHIRDSRAVDVDWVKATGAGQWYCRVCSRRVKLRED